MSTRFQDVKVRWPEKPGQSIEIGVIDSGGSLQLAGINKGLHIEAAPEYRGGEYDFPVLAMRGPKGERLIAVNLYRGLTRKEIDRRVRAMMPPLQRRKKK